MTAKIGNIWEIGGKISGNWWKNMGNDGKIYGSDGKCVEGPGTYGKYYGKRWKMWENDGKLYDTPPEVELFFAQDGGFLYGFLVFFYGTISKSSSNSAFRNV